MPLCCECGSCTVAIADVDSSKEESKRQFTVHLCLSAIFIRTQILDMLGSANIFGARGALKADPTVRPHMLDVRWARFDRRRRIIFASTLNIRPGNPEDSRAPLNLFSR